MKHLAMIGMALFPPLRAMVAREAQYSREVLRAMMVLPGKYRYSRVEAAIQAAGVLPRDIYECLAANGRTIALERFYEALNGPQQ